MMRAASLHSSLSVQTARARLVHWRESRLAILVTDHLLGMGKVRITPSLPQMCFIEKLLAGFTKFQGWACYGMKSKLCQQRLLTEIKQQVD